VSAQEAIYRCGREYTNAPRDVSRCERLAEQSVTVISGMRPHAVSSTSTLQAVRPKGAHPLATPQPSARTVLAPTLARLEKQHQAWAQEVESLLSQTGTAEYGAAPKNQDRVVVLQASMAQAEREMENLQRELARGSQAPEPEALQTAQGATPRAMTTPSALRSPLP
jgi:hypothetical protein